MSQAERSALDRTQGFWGRFSAILNEKVDLRAPYPVVALLVAVSGFVAPKDYNAIQARVDTLLATRVK